MICLDSLTQCWKVGSSFWFWSKDSDSTLVGNQLVHVTFWSLFLQSTLENPQHISTITCNTEIVLQAQCLHWRHLSWHFAFLQSNSCMHMHVQQRKLCSRKRKHGTKGQRGTSFCSVFSLGYSFVYPHVLPFRSILWSKEGLFLLTPHSPGPAFGAEALYIASSTGNLVHQTLSFRYGPWQSTTAHRNFYFSLIFWSQFILSLSFVKYY